MNFINRYPRTIVLLAVILFSFTTLAQPPTDVKPELGKAQELINNNKLKEAKELYLKYADHLTMDEQIMLGLLYLHGDTAKKDVTNALKWIGKAADKGSSKAMMTIGSIYHQGINAPRDTVTAFTWFKKAAHNKSTDAMLAVAKMYQAGINTKADETEAIYWYKTVAENGKSEGYYNIGEIYFAKNDYKNALEWYHKGAKINDPSSMLKIGEMTENGIGIVKDKEKAVSWYKRIVKKNYSKASSKANERLRAIGGALPSTDINTIKPLLTRIAAGVNNNFSSLMGSEIRPDGEPAGSPISEMSYYKCLVETGFKNVYIRKEVTRKIEAENVNIKGGTRYLYSADIVYALSEEEGEKIYKEWVKVLKAVFPGFENRQVSTGYHVFSGYINNGSKRVSIGISHSPFVDFKPVSISISESYY